MAAAVQAAPVLRDEPIYLDLQTTSLVAVANGLGSGIVVLWGEREMEVKKIFGIPQDHELAAVLKIGEPGEVPPLRRPEFSRLHKNRF